MDDGGVIKQGGLYLHTNSYKKKEVEYLIGILEAGSIFHVLLD